MITVLCTGGCGYVGYYVCRLLLKKELYRVISIDNLGNSVQSNVDTLMINPLFTNYIGDCRDKELLNKVFTRHTIDIVIHLAALKSVKESTENPILYLSNVSMTISLLEVMEAYNCRKIVFSSSACVYSDNQLSPISENGSINPSNPYGIGKRAVEKLLSTLGSKWNIACLRYFNPIGGVDNILKSNNIIPSISRACIEGRPFTINGCDYNTKDGTCIRDYISIYDVARAHVLSLENLDTMKYEIVNIGSGVGVSVMDLINAYINEHNVKLDIVRGCRREGDIPMYYADITKAYNLLGWSPTMNLRNTIATINRLDE
jgi:UDP-glucose 4-epimerase